MGQKAGIATLALALACAVADARPAGAQARPPKSSRPASSGAAGSSASSDLRARFGTDLALRLLQSVDPDERLRGLERAAAVHTPEAFALLERASKARLPAVADAHVPLEGAARRDPRALLVVVRALASWLDHEQARAALASIVDAPSQSFDTRAGTALDGDPIADDAEGAARVLLARQQAAMALAESGNLLALEALIAIARSAGAGQGPALDALAIYPPASPVLGGVVLTTPATVALAVTVGDLQSLDAIEAALSASDPALRAAALGALGVAGDTRAVEGARGALNDRDARVRLAAGNALVRLGTADAPQAVERLIQDDATALDGLRLAQWLQGEGVTKAAAARAVVSASEDIRSAAVVALGRQTTASAVSALIVLAADPAMQGEAACAIARSPSSAALSALETMSGAPTQRRLAARAYFVRRWVRRERSPRLDALLGELSRSSDARDRAVGVEAQVALGELPAASALQDGDARVRRAAAMGAYAASDSSGRAALLSRLRVEADEATRQVLSNGLVDGDSAGVVPTQELAARARAGAPDAPLAVLALAKRTAAEGAADIDPWLSSRDAVLRAHAARGLGASGARAAVGRLVGAYAREGDVGVRRAIVTALSRLGGDRPSAPELARTLELAARLDPDRVARWTALRALSSAPPLDDSIGRDVAWLRLVAAEGAPAPRPTTALLTTSSGVALAIAFDDDGYAIVPGVAPGEAHLRLAPQPPPYDAPRP